MPDLNAPTDLFVVDDDIRHVTMLNAGVMRATAAEPVLDDADSFLVTVDLAGVLNRAEDDGERPTYSERFLLTDDAAMWLIRQLTLARADRLDLLAQLETGEPTA